MTAAPVFLESSERFDAFLAAFEDGSWPVSGWTHSAHVAMAVAHVRSYPNGTLDRVRGAIRHYNDKQGTPNTETSGYHETLTRFWLAIVADFLRREVFASDLEAANAAVARFGAERGLHTGYYSFDVVRSREARADWVPPDLAALPSGSEHETLPFASDLEAATAAVARFGAERGLHTGYCSFDVVRSREVRAEWIPPDLAASP